MRPIAKNPALLTAYACRDDPTIFSINLMNEPRCECNPPAIPLPANYSILPSCQAGSCADACREMHVYMSGFYMTARCNIK